MDFVHWDARDTTSSQVDPAGDWPIPIIATQDVACGAKLWSTAGKLRATVVVKATFYLVRGGPMRLVNPAPILLGDQHHEQSVDRSVVAPSDCALYLPRAEVLFAGHAYAPTPSPFVPIRLAVVGSRPLVDKTLHVYGERMWLEGEQMTAPVPFTRIPIRYERAFRGPPGFEENPVGMAKGPGLAVHNVIDPSDPEAPAGLGPIAPYWPPRRRLLRSLDPAVVQANRPELPDTFAWSFFHAAPPDQRCSFFEGNEWIVLEGLHPEHPRFESQLPSARARARLYSADSTSHREIGLAADTLWIDGDRSLCCVLYRGNFEVDNEGMLESMQLFAGLEMPGRTIPWPGAQRPSADAVSPPAGAAAPSPEAALAGANAVAHTPGVATPIRPPSGQYAAVTGMAVTPAPTGPFAPRVTPQPFGAVQPTLATSPSPDGAPQRGASQSLLAALASEPAAASPAEGPKGWPSAGATLASPIAVAQAVAAMQQNVAEVAIHKPPSSSAGYVRVDASWLEEGPAPSTDPLGLRPDGSEPPSPVGTATMGNTLTQPPSQLRSLLQQARAVEEQAPAATKRHIHIEDSPTVAPDTGDLARILQEAEARAAEEPEVAKKNEPLGARPSPAALRAQKTTIRGLGTSGVGGGRAAEPAEPPPTARVALENLNQGEESPTAQLPVPEVLLRLAAQPTSSPQPKLAPSVPDEQEEEAPSSLEDTSSFNDPAPPPPLPPPPVAARGDTNAPPPPTVASPSTPFPPFVSAKAPPPPIELDDDDTGRPTLSGMEAPPIAPLQLPPEVHAGEAKMDLERRIREGESLEGLDLSDLDLAGFDLSGKKLAGCRFDRTSLRKARLRGADLSGASLEGADLAEADLEDALLERTNFVSAKLSGASLRRAFLTDANLTTADVRRAALDEASGERTILCRARLDGASALGCKLDAADLTEAQVDGASFDGSLLPDLRAYEVSAEDTSFQRCMIRNARFDGAVVSRARFDHASAEDSMWDRAVLDAASFEGTKLVGASFTKASLRGATMSHSDLEDARFNRANLTGAKFVGVDLGRLTLDGADLTGIVTG